MPDYCIAVTGTAGTDGFCGWQHDCAPCLVQQGRTCCSVNGYCGSNETYCGNGCQPGYDCDVSSTISSSTSSISSATLSHSSTNTPITTATHSSNNATIHSTSSGSQSLSPTTNPTSSPSGSSTAAATNNSSGISHKAVIGVAVGASIGGLIFLVLIGFLIACIWRRSNNTRGPITRTVSSSPAAQQMMQQQQTPPVQYVTPVGYHPGPNAGEDFRLYHGTPQGS